MDYSKLNRAAHWLVRSIQLQLYLTLISGPILAYWGLPVSVASPIGNILFHPLLTAFLFLSSLIFFCQILHIPHEFFVYGLTKISHAFHYFLGLGTQRWLMGFAKPPLWILFALPLSTAFIFCCKKTRTLFASIGCLLGLSVMFGTYLKYTCNPVPITTITCNRGHINILYVNNQTIVIDPGLLGTNISSASWVEFTLIPTIVTLTGQTTISHLIVLQPSQLTFEALRALCTTCMVQKIYMPLWRGKMSAGQRRAYAKLMEIIRINNVEIIRLSHGMDIEIGIDKLTITPQPQTIYSKEINYQAWHISGAIKGYLVDISSQKLLKKNRSQKIRA